MVVWSQVEAGVAVVAACLPTLRPLLFGKSIDSLIGSIRSMLSLNSIPRSPNIERRGSDSETLTDGNGLPGDGIMMQDAMAFKEAHADNV